MSALCRKHSEEGTASCFRDTSFKSTMRCSEACFDLQESHLLLAHEVLRGLCHDDAAEALDDLLQLCVYLYETAQMHSITLRPIV